jgi:hypothetical protein
MLFTILNAVMIMPVRLPVNTPVRSRRYRVRTIGHETARCVGFFSAANVESTFDRPMMPFGDRKVGTPLVESVAQLVESAS